MNNRVVYHQLLRRDIKRFFRWHPLSSKSGKTHSSKNCAKLSAPKTYFQNLKNYSFMSAMVCRNTSISLAQWSFPTQPKKRQKFLKCYQTKGSALRRAERVRDFRAAPSRSIVES